MWLLQSAVWHNQFVMLDEEVHGSSESESDNEIVSEISEHHIMTDEISEVAADFLYSQAGTDIREPGERGEVVILPQPHILLTSHEHLIHEAKVSLNINFELEYFQIQSLLGMYCLFFD